MIVDYTLIVDGTSDDALRHVVDWTLLHVVPDLRVREVQVHPRRHRPVREAIDEARTAYGHALVLVHRDAERSAWGARAKEIPDDVVRVVPVRMTEAWLLADADAIRHAAGNPAGVHPLRLPPLARLERLPDPKAMLDDLILVAAGSPTGRRRKQLVQQLGRRRRLVAEYTRTFEPLWELSAFQRFVDELRGALERLALR